MFLFTFIVIVEVVFFLSWKLFDNNEYAIIRLGLCPTKFWNYAMAREGKNSRKEKAYYIK